MNLLSSLLAFTARKIQTLMTSAESFATRIEATETRMTQAEAKVDNFTLNSKPNTVVNLWLGELETIGSSVTLSQSIDNFDFIDIYTSTGAFKRAAVSAGATLVTSSNLSDDASSTVFQSGEARVTFAGTTLTLQRATLWAWTPEATYTQPSVSAEILGAIVRVDGVKIGATSPAELTDIRVGEDGAIYNSAGDAVRDQIGNVKDSLEIVQDALVPILPYNKMNMAAIITGKGISTSGALIDNSSACTSDFMPVQKDDIVYITGINSGGTFYKPTAITVQRLALYDSNKTFVSYTDWANSYTVPSDGYIRIVMASSWASWQVVSVTLNTYPTVKEEVVAYEPPKYELVQTTAGKVTDSKLIMINPENKLNMNDSDLKLDSIIQSTGAIAENNTCFTSGFIPAKKGDVITYSKLKDGNFQRRLAIMTRVAYYDNKKHFLSASDTFVGNDVVVPENSCAYVRTCLPNDALTADVACVSVNAKPAQASIEEYYTPYYSANGVLESTMQSKRVLWLGTSIPTYGYPQLLGKYVGANVINNALGSSGIAKGVRSNITTANICGIRNIYGLFGLTQTVAEKQVLIDNWDDIAEEIGSTAELTADLQNLSLNYSSYETILDPYLSGSNKVDLIVLNHCYNDSEVSADVLIGDDPFDVYTMEGAYNWLINHIWKTDPTIGIVIFGHYTDLSEAKETALQRVADRWHIPYYLLKNDLGWSNTQTISTTKRVNAEGEWESITETEMTYKNMWCGDGLHPLGVASVRIAQVATAEFDKWVKAFCNHDPHSSY